MRSAGSNLASAAAVSSSALAAGCPSVAACGVDGEALQPAQAVIHAKTNAGMKRVGVRDIALSYEVRGGRRGMTALEDPGELF
jgi:hypothetical protein